MRDEVRADALLASLEEEHKGKLKVFLGAAPGVGKTYAMLSEGHRRAARGTDVVIAYVEHHARPNTMAMAVGLEAVDDLKADLARGLALIA